MPTALIYARVSTDRQSEEGSSLSTQEARCRAYCAEKGYAVSGIFLDAYTASEWRERPQLRHLLDVLALGGVDVVVCYALDRLSRNQTAIAVLVDLFEQHGARLELVTEDFEDSAVGRFIRNAKAFAAEVELEKIRERTQRAKLAYFRAGKRHPGKTPSYGLRWTDDTKQGAEPDPDTADVVRRIFALCCAGTPTLGIARTLTAEGVPTPSGGAVWQESTVAHVLHNPLYKGVVIGRRYRRYRQRGKWRQTERPEEEQIPLPDWPVEALVDEVTWQRAQDRLRRNKVERRGRTDPEGFLLRGGYARCGTCGGVLSVQRKFGGRYHYYRCQAPTRDPSRCDYPAGYRAEDMDAAAWQAAVSTLRRLRLLVRRMERQTQTETARKTAAQRARDAATLDRARRVKQIDRELANQTRALAREDDPDLQDAIRAHMRALVVEKRSLLAPAVTEDGQPVSTAATVDELRDLVALLARAKTYQERRHVLERLGLRVLVWRRDHEPPYQITSVLLSSMENIQDFWKDEVKAQ